MTDSLVHPEPDRLEAFVEGTLPDADRAVVAFHVQQCAVCQQELEEWRALFGALASLPRPEPLPGFAARVMAEVRVTRPWPTRAAAWAERWGSRLVPQTTAGWALVAALVVLPILTMGGAATWLATRPWFSVQWFWIMAQERATAAAGAVLATALDTVMQSPVAAWLTATAEPLLGVGLASIGAAAAAFAALMLGSAWILYRNLVEDRVVQGRSHASYSF